MSLAAQSSGWRTVRRRARRFGLDRLSEVVASRMFSDRVRWRMYRALGYDVSRSRLQSGITFGSRNITIAEDAYANRDVQFEGAGHITVGTKTQIAPRVQILTSTHDIGHSQQRAGTFKQLAVRIGAGVWIGAGSIILPGVTIGDGAVVAAGSVVASDVDQNTLVGGSPARLLRSLSSD